MIEQAASEGYRSQGTVLANAAPVRLAVLVVGHRRGLQGIKHDAFLMALRRHFPQLEVWGIDTGRVDRMIGLLRGFSPSKARWRAKFNSHPRTFDGRTAAFGQMVERSGNRIDAFLQIGTTFDASRHAGGRPVVVYTDYAVPLTARLGRSWRMPLADRLIAGRIGQEGVALRGAAHVCSRSRFVAEAIIAAHHLPRGRISVVGGGANLPLAPRPKPGDGLRLLFVGREFPRKGGDLVLDAFARLRRAYPDARLDCVTASRYHQATAGVFWHDALAGQDLPHLFENADIFVLASRFETWGDVLIEAMTAGAACVVVDQPPMNEIIHAGADGLTVAPQDAAALADALMRLAQDADLRARLGAAAHERTRSEFNWEVVTDRLAGRIMAVAADTAGTAAHRERSP